MVSIFYQTLYCLKNLAGLILTVWLESVKTVKLSCYTVHSAYPEDSFERLFWEQQKQASLLKNAKSMRWHPVFISGAFILGTSQGI